MTQPVFLRSEAGCQISLQAKISVGQGMAQGRIVDVPLILTLLVTPLIKSLLPRRVARVERCMRRASKANNILHTLPDGLMLTWAAQDRDRAKALVKRIDRLLFDPISPKRVAGLWGLSLAELSHVPTAPSAKRLGERHGKRYSYDLYSLSELIEVAYVLGPRSILGDDAE